MMVDVLALAPRPVLARGMVRIESAMSVASFESGVLPITSASPFTICARYMGGL